MASKTASSGKESASNEAFDELEQLRLIVFGQAKNDLEQKIANVYKDLSEKLTASSNQIQQDILNVNQKIDQQLTALTSSLNHSIAAVDNTCETNRIAFEEANNALSSQLEMAENANKDDSDLIHKRIDDEVENIKIAADVSMKDIVAQLERVTFELTSSKTDRKTLAQLLSTMASNLDADD